MNFSVKWTHERLDALEQVVREVIEEVGSSPRVRAHWHGVLNGEQAKPHVPRIQNFEIGTPDHPLFNIECSCGWKSTAKPLCELSSTWQSHSIMDSGRDA